MARIQLDASQLESWTNVLVRAVAVTEREAEKVVSKGALNIKNDARKNAPKGPHLPYYADSINYDLTRSRGEIMAEVGPVQGRRQWGLGNLLEYGSQNNPPHPHLEPALDKEAPLFYLAALRLAGDIIDG